MTALVTLCHAKKAGSLGPLWTPTQLQEFITSWRSYGISLLRPLWTPLFPSRGNIDKPPLEIATRSKCRCKSWRPNSLPTDFCSFVGTDRKSISVPPAEKNRGLPVAPRALRAHTQTHTRTPSWYGRTQSKKVCFTTKPLKHKTKRRKPIPKIGTRVAGT